MSQKPIAPASPLPWSYDCDYESRGEAACAKLLDANGKIICDTLNSDVVELHTQYDGPVRQTWDENGRKNLLFAMRAANCHDRLIAAAKEFLRHACRPGDDGKYDDGYDTTRDALNAILAEAEGTP